MFIFLFLSVKMAAPRLARMICKMKAKGIGASPIGPGSCLASQATYIDAEMEPEPL